MRERGPGSPQAPLNPHQLQGLQAAQLAGRITAREYAEVTGRTLVAARQDLADLVARGVLVRQGTGRTRSYTPAGAAARPAASRPEGVAEPGRPDGEPR